MPTAPRDRVCDILVLGGNPGGPEAACAAARAGAHVILLGGPARRVAARAGAEAVPGTPWAAFAPDEVAAIVDGRSVVFRPRRLVLALAPIPLHAGAVMPAARSAIVGPAAPGAWFADTTLPRALGASHALRGPGIPATAIDAEGRSSVPTLFVVPGDDPWCRGLGRAAGAAAARDLGLPAPRRRVWRGPRPALPRQEALADEEIACPCEGVAAAAIRAALRDGARSMPAVKRATRAGMGPCQGRLCGPALHLLCGTTDEAGFPAPRAPWRPVPVAALMQDFEVHAAPIAAPPVTRWTTVPPAPALPVSTCDALVIGGGVVGLCAALYLARAGIDVALIDRAEPGSGASTANAGSLHVQLLPYDFDDGDPGPLGDALALGPASIALWRALAADAAETFGIRTEGGLVLAANDADLAWLARKAAFERARGVATEIIGPAELAALAPFLARTAAGAAFCAAEGQIDPLRGTIALLRLARDSGVRIAAGVEVVAMERNGSAWRVQTRSGPIIANQVLNAAGAHAAGVAALAGDALPIRAVVQQVIATAPAPPMLRHLVAQARLHLSLKQGDTGHMLVGGGWPGRLDPDGATRLDRRAIQGNLWTAARVLPALAAIDVVRAWTGLTVHLDRGPVIGASPGRPGLFHAVTANGYTLGPIAGRLIADAMLGRGAPPSAFAV